MFLVDLGNIPEDVALVAVGLNGQEFPLQAKTVTGFTIAEAVHNKTRGYTLKVPFDHPVVIKQVRFRSVFTMEATACFILLKCVVVSKA